MAAQALFTDWATPLLSGPLSCPLAPAKPPKIERHDLAAKLHHTNTGLRPVDRYCQHSDGLFVSRRFVAHPRIRAWHAHLLPALGLQICRYDFYGVREHDYYLDLATITEDGSVWTMHDHYLDVLIWRGKRAEVVDEDEFLSAALAGYLPQQQAERVWEQARTLLSDLAQHGFELGAYLAAQGVDPRLADFGEVPLCS
ncbi:DUF402 domain-containing protein [Deinococcus detaillensis]|uniref:DUF402 domain-containing protein n=1 Tax=Deinococcus detaillensis TaxID=2592048 RepID=A0A553USN8_9DEIO|nr:DUF402 domain-containing protein [Deinococcus detaillensis]TSA83021.1 DUF402 domain-containing protein [Deinococcus detaillensis]